MGLPRLRPPSGMCSDALPNENVGPSQAGGGRETLKKKEEEGKKDIKLGIREKTKEVVSL